MRAWAVVAVALLISGCAGPDYGTKVLDSTQALADVLAPAGWRCNADGALVTAESVAAFGFKSSDCSDGALAIWASAAKRDEVLAKNSRPGWCRISRSNWTVMGTQSLIGAAQSVVGGEVVCQ